MTIDRGIGSWPEGWARVKPDAAALIHGETRTTYADVATRVRRLAQGLRARGVERGDRVGWLGANHPAFLELLFATAQLGAVFAPVNHRLDPATIDTLLDDYGTELVVIERSGVGVALPTCVRIRIGVDGVEDADVDHEDVIAQAADDPLDVAVGLEDVCLLQHTSGTTGRPKGVMLTHGNVQWNVFNLLSVVDFRGDDVTIAIAPFFRTGGTGVNVLPVLFKGGAVVVPETTEPDEILGLIERHRVTIGFGNPDLLDALLRAPRWPTADLSSVRSYMTGGAPVPDRLIRTYLERGVTFVQGYGLSEASPLVLLLDEASVLQKIGSAGKPPLFVDVRTVRPDGLDCAPNETGELLARGPNVMKGYWNRDEATRAAIDEDGWLRTGDAARVDNDGYVWIVDRVEDAFELDGRTLYPGDIERALTHHVAIADAAVVPHAGTVRAFVVLAPATELDHDALLTLCRECLPPGTATPTVAVVDELPRSSVGKLLRHELLRVSGSAAR